MTKQHKWIATLAIGMFLVPAALVAPPVAASDGCEAQAQLPDVQSLVNEVVTQGGTINDLVECLGGAVEGPILPNGETYDFRGHPGQVGCKGTYKKIPQNTEAFLAQFTGATAPQNVSSPKFCPPCAVVAAVVGVIMLSIALYNLYKDLTADPAWIYDQEITCTADGFTYGLGSSGGLLRDVVIRHAGGETEFCDYDGVVTTGCDFDVTVPAPVTWSEHIVDDIVYSTATPCFSPNALAINRPQYEITGILQPPTSRSFTDFHPDGVCTGDISISWVEETNFLD